MHNLFQKLFKSKSFYLQLHNDIHRTPTAMFLLELLLKWSKHSTTYKSYEKIRGALILANVFVVHMFLQIVTSVTSIVAILASKRFHPGVVPHVTHQGRRICEELVANPAVRLFHLSVANGVRCVWNRYMISTSTYNVL